MTIIWCIKDRGKSIVGNGVNNHGSQQNEEIATSIYCKNKNSTIGLEMFMVMLYQNQFSYFSKDLFPYRNASVLLPMLCITNYFQITLLWWRHRLYCHSCFLGLTCFTIFLCSRTVLVSQFKTQRGEASYEEFQPWKILVVYLLYSFTLINLV